jgi:hypothetical protein
MPKTATAWKSIRSGVLSVGFQIPVYTRKMAQDFGFKLDRYGFAEKSTFEPLKQPQRHFRPAEF